jgi:hypothetical protein
MAITRVGTTGTFSAVASGNMTPTNPASLTTNDILICFLNQGDNVVATMPAGWTRVDATNYTRNSGASRRIDAFWKLVTDGAGESGAAVTVTRAAGGTGMAVIAAYSGVHTTSPIVAALSQATATSGTTITAPSITSTAANQMLILQGNSADDGTLGVWSGTTPSVSEFFDQLTALGTQDAGLSLSDGIRATAGTSGARTASSTRTIANHIGGSIFLAEAAGGGNTTLNGGAGSGSFTWTGSAMTPRFTIPADTGSYAWTGTAATTFKSIITSAQSGTFTWSGQSLVGVFRMPADGGTFSWTGSDANTFKSFVLSALAGSVIWTGQASALSFVMPAESGSYAWDGTAATTFKGALLEAQTGSFSWDGSNATLSYSGGGGETYVCSLSTKGAG